MKKPQGNEVPSPNYSKQSSVHLQKLPKMLIFPHTIRGLLFFLLLVVLLPVIGIQFLIYKDRIDTRREMEIQSTLELARSQAVSVDILLKNWKNRARDIGSLVFSDSNAKSSASFLENFSEGYEGVEDISFVSPTGDVQVSSRRGAVGLNIADRPFFQAILEGYDYVVSDVFQAKSDNKSVITIGNAAREDSTGKLIGIVLITINVDDAAFFSKIALYKEGNITIIDTSGRIVFRYPQAKMPYPEHYVTDIYPELGYVYEGNEYAGISSRTLDEAKRMYAMVPIEPWGWVARVSRNETEVMEPIYSSLYRNGGLFFSVILFSFLCALLFSKRISTPIKDLRKPAKELRAGETPHPVPVRGPLEIKEFCLAFNEMAKEVSSKRELMKQKVQERTTDLNKRIHQLARLTSELTLSEHRERQRLARVLHDDLQQFLVAAKMKSEILSTSLSDKYKKEAQSLNSLITQSIDISRSLTTELSPPALKEGRISAALEWLIDWMHQNHELVVQMDADPELTLKRNDVAVLLFQSVRELLLNVVKHSGVKSAKLELGCSDDDYLRVAVIDSGVGFDSSTYEKNGTGFGLSSIRERLDYIGGSMEVESSPGKGASFLLYIPTK